MELSVCNVNRQLNDIKKVKMLMERSFPPEERFPFSLLRLMTLRDGIDFQAYYEGDSFVGFTYSITEENHVFLLFLAVNHRRRNQGMGSRILKLFREENPGKIIVLNSENPVPGSENLNERISRLRFYKWNGFSPSGYLVRDRNDTYVILSAGTGFSVDTYMKALGRMTFGLYKPEILPEE